MPLTILQAAYPFAPVGPMAVGGAEEILSTLDRALSDCGHRSLVVACTGSRPHGKLFPVPRPTEPLCQLSVAAQAEARAEYQASLDRALASTQVDLLHMHGLDFHQYRLPRHLPVLVTLHLPIAWYESSQGMDVWSRLDSNVYLQCVSEQQLFSSPPDVHPVALIQNGVAIPPHLPPLAPEDAFLPDNFALVLGRICPEKNAAEALQAGTLAGLPVWIGGEVFPYEAHQRYFREQIEPLLNSGSGPQHRFLGPLAPKRRHALLARARCLLHPTLAPETSSLVAMEAMASGTPVIAYPSGALPEIVQDGVTGIFVNSPETMAAAIHEVTRLSRAGCRRTAAERFSSSRMIEDYFGLYKKLIALHEQGSPRPHTLARFPACPAELAHR